MTPRPITQALGQLSTDDGLPAHIDGAIETLRAALQIPEGP